MQRKYLCFSLFVSKILPTSKVIWGWGHIRLRIPSYRLEKPGMKPTTPGLKVCVCVVGGGGGGGAAGVCICVYG